MFLSLQEWNVTRLTFENDPEPYGKERDGAIIKMAQEFGVETVIKNSHTLYNLDRLVAARSLFRSHSVALLLQLKVRRCFLFPVTTLQMFVLRVQLKTLRLCWNKAVMSSDNNVRKWRSDEFQQKSELISGNPPNFVWFVCFSGYFGTTSSEVVTFSILIGD